MPKRVVAAVSAILALAVLLVLPHHIEGPVIALVDRAVGADTSSQHVTVFNVVEVGGNIAVFMVVAALVSIAARRWWLGIIAGVALSIAGESAQAFIPGRVASIGDVATNAIGALLGGTMVLATRNLRARRGSRTAPQSE